jgi:hypothetical protein
VGGLKHQEKRSMEHFAGLDVSVKETSLCIVDGTGKIVREVKVASEPDTLLAVLTNPAYHFKRIGLKAGPLSHWLFSALAAHASGVEGADQQDRSQRCPRYRPDDAGRALSPGACEDATQSSFCNRKPLLLRMTCVPPCATSVSTDHGGCGRALFKSGT